MQDKTANDIHVVEGIDSDIMKNGDTSEKTKCGDPVHSDEEEAEENETDISTLQDSQQERPSRRGEEGTVGWGWGY